MTTMTSAELGAHLEAHGAATVLLPSPDGDDYLAATIDGLTIEVFYTSAGFSRAIVAGPGVNETYDDLYELLRHLSMPTGDEAADLAAAVEQWQRSLPPTPKRDPRGRIVGAPVVVGDVWANYGVLTRGRTFRITAITDGYAYGVVLTDTDETRRMLDCNTDALRHRCEQPYPWAVSHIGRSIRVKLSRMRPTADGYYRAER